MNNAGLVFVYALGGLGLIKGDPKGGGKTIVTPLGWVAIAAVVGGAVYLARKKGLL